MWNSIIKCLHFFIYTDITRRAAYNREKVLPLLWKAAWLIQTELWETGNSESATSFRFCSSRVLIWPKLFHLPVCKMGLSLRVIGGASFLKKLYLHDTSFKSRICESVKILCVYLLCSRPQIAVRLLAHKIQSPQEWEAVQALTVGSPYPSSKIQDVCYCIPWVG